MTKKITIITASITGLLILVTVSLILVISSCDFSFGNHTDNETELNGFNMSVFPKEIHFGISEGMPDPMSVLNPDEEYDFRYVKLETDCMGDTPGIYEGTYSFKYNNKDYFHDVTIYVEEDRFLPAGYYNFIEMFGAAELLVEIEKYYYDNVMNKIPLYSESLNQYIVDDVIYSEEKPPYENNRYLYTTKKPTSVEPDLLRVGLRDLELLNPWDFGYNDFSVHDLIQGRLYQQRNIDGYIDDYALGLAASNPLPIGYSYDNGEIVSYKWQITLKEDLTWKYDETFDQTVLPEGHEVLNAYDYYETYQLASLHDWWILNNHRFGEIPGIYGDPLASVSEESGLPFIRVIDENTFEFRFSEQLSEIQVMKVFSSPKLSPINVEMYNYIETLDGVEYGMNEYYMAYAGTHYVTDMEVDSSGNPTMYNIERNPNHPTYRLLKYEQYGYDSYEFYSRSYNNLFDFYEWITGCNLDVMIPYFNDMSEYMREFPTRQTGYLYFDTHTEVPLLHQLEFRKAMYFLMQDKLSDHKDYVKQASVINPKAKIDNNDEYPFVFLDIDRDYVKDTYINNREYDYEEAFDTLMNNLVQSGIYQAGTEENPTVINIIISGRSNIGVMEEIKEMMETHFIDETNHIMLHVETHNCRELDCYPNPDLFIREDDIWGAFETFIFDYRNDDAIYTNSNMPEILMSYDENEYVFSYDALTDRLGTISYISEGIIKKPVINETYLSNNTAIFTVDLDPVFEIEIIQLSYYDPDTGSTAVEVLTLNDSQLVINHLVEDRAYFIEIYYKYQGENRDEIEYYNFRPTSNN